jgi:hypothetical protein
VERLLADGQDTLAMRIRAQLDQLTAAMRQARLYAAPRRTEPGE